jgi:formylglycine-generating enzyme required for sulfatase activity
MGAQPTFMRRVISIPNSSKDPVAAIATARRGLRRAAPGRVDIKMWVALAWVLGMALIIGCATSGRNPGADAKPGPAPVTVSLPGNVALDLVWIAPGTFTMGSPATEANRNSEEGPQTQVTLTKGFWLGKYLVMQGQYQAVMGSNPSCFSALGKDVPVEQVSWDDAMMFCQKLTAQERAAGRLPTGYIFTLPTEAQWEYACRAGTTGPYAGKLDAIAWYRDNSSGTTHPVGTKQANTWGLYDMHGNVCEWCADWYGESYPGGSVTNPLGPASGTYRVFRGGGWNFVAAGCRSAFRPKGWPRLRYYYLGFRVALSSGP